MRVRTPNEREAYAEGYNACYEDFIRELKSNKTLPEVLTKMKLLKSVVNVAAQREEQKNELVSTNRQG